MEEIKQVPEDSLLFQEVASVIGDSDARYQLDHASATFTDTDWQDILEGDANLWGAFYWDNTPQGYDYWENIACSYNTL